MNNNTFVHKYIKGLINKNDEVADMTMGNGFDTLFLANISKFVYSFDINKQALENTYEKVKDKDNVKLILDNHNNIDKYLGHKVKLFLFNLGYRPNCDQTPITHKDDTLVAFKKAYDLLEHNGYIIITFYLGHKGGKDEYYLLDNYFKDNNINIIDKYRNFRHADEPITYIIKKLPL